MTQLVVRRPLLDFGGFVDAAVQDEVLRLAPSLGIWRR